LKYFLNCTFKIN